MTVSIRFLGTAAFEVITADCKRILLDPYLDENNKSPYKVADLEHLDLLLVTHAAYDHLGDTEKILRKFPKLPLICGADVRGYLMHRGLDGASDPVGHDDRRRRRKDPTRVLPPLVIYSNRRRSGFFQHAPGIHRLRRG